MTTHTPSCGSLSCRVCRTAAEEGRLQAIAEFDHPFVVTEDGSVHGAHSSVRAPEVFHDEADDITIDLVPYKDSDTWEPLVGFTGQHGYNGAVLHASEYLGGGLAAHILGTPGTYVVVTVEVHPEDDEEGSEDPFPAGWAVLRRKHTYTEKSRPDGSYDARCSCGAATVVFTANGPGPEWHASHVAGRIPGQEPR